MAQPYPKAFPPELRDAAIATTRFGYGPLPGQLSGIASDPRGWLLAQLAAPREQSRYLMDLPSGAVIATGLIGARAGGPGAVRHYRRDAQARLEREALAHTAHSLAARAPFMERLVRFWCNFFGITTADQKAFPLVYAFEREVVRPNLTGTFATLLTEAARHPAMILAFDNTSSVGPYSVAGVNGAAGMNPALAGQILSRLTLRDETAFTDKDVIELTKMLTGWSVAGPDEPNAGQFVFRGNLHQPNKKYFLGRGYPEAGALEAEAALDALSRRETTARNIATRMARAFIADSPPENLIDDMVDGYASGGNSLAGLAEGLIRSEYAWVPVQSKAKSPEDLVFSIARSLNYGPERAGLVLRSQRALGQAPKRAPVAAGWPDLDAAWMSPQQLIERVQWAATASRDGIQRLGGTNITDFALSILGPLLSAATYRRLVVTRDPTEALTLLFTSPEFQRR